MPGSALTRLLPLEPPLVPDGDQAREWAQRELAKPIYNQGPSLLERIARWLGARWQQILDAADGLGAVFGPLLILVLVLAVVAVVFIIGVPVRRRRLARSCSGAVLEEGDVRDAAQLRKAAAAAAAAGDFALAVIEQFRAVVRGMDERAIGDDAEGRTAHEAARAGAQRLPQRREDLEEAATLFDAVRYGDAPAGPAEYERLRAVDSDVAATRPSTLQDAAAQDRTPAR